jgi:hypothetical protein
MRLEEIELPPVILLGTHRSGTTLLLRLLRDLGLFAGARLDTNGEAIFFHRLNEWILRRAGGAWDHPTPVRKLLDDARLRGIAEGIFRRQLESRAFAGFTGSAAHRIFNRTHVLTRPWGWKDPRTVFTFRIWESLFPRCRILSIRRNGVDVARSLVERAEEWIGTGIHTLSIRSLVPRLKAALYPLECPGHFYVSARCTTLEEGFALWEEYVEEAEGLFARFEGPKLAVSFEDLVRDPVPALREIAGFCGLDAAGIRGCATAETIVKGRAFAFLQDAALRRFFDRVRGRRWMRELGYEELPDGPS